MSARDDNFCDTYRADPEVANRIRNGATDFYRRYQSWDQEGKPSDPSSMLQFFGLWHDADAALKTSGVLESDCKAFKEFVDLSDDFTYSAEEIAQLQANNRLLSADDPLTVAFEAGLKKYFQGREPDLTQLERAVLNGALFVQISLSVSDISTSKPDRRLFAVPGFIAFGMFNRPLNDPYWIGVDKILSDAFDKFGDRRINVWGAAQLRLGEKNGMFGPVDLAPGFVIMGRV